MERGARLHLIGAGPGKVDLLTVGAYRALEECDLVVADQLISDEILALPRRRGIPVHVSAPKRRALEASESYKRVSDGAQDELNEIGLEALKSGKHVVRLKQGDPYLYGRGAEEILFFRNRGFEAEVIPGVSSGLAIPGIPVTHKGVADKVTICSGSTADCKLPAYDEMTTVVVLMCVRRLQEIVNEMVKQLGYPESTPAAIVQNSYAEAECKITGDLGNIVEAAQVNRVKNPAVLVVGKTVSVLSGSCDL